MNESNLEDFNIDVEFDNLYESDGLLSDLQELSSSFDEEGAGEYVVDNESSDIDYTSILTSMESSISSASSTLVAINDQQVLVFDKLFVLEEHLQFIICFLIVFTILAVVKICFAIFNKILGLGQA